MKRAPGLRRGHPERSISLWECLAEELCAGGRDPELRRQLDEHLAQPAPAEEADADFRKLVIQRRHAFQSSALCFSGGGIRSATFGLGLLQALAAHSCPAGQQGAEGLLGEIDYLSTVSGGGYLGGWFSGWAARAKTGTSQVICDLAVTPETDWEPEPEPIRQLRKFAYYLDPKLGVLSADTWTLAATIARNLLLNWLVLLPLLAGVLALPRVLFKLVDDSLYYDWGWMLYAAAALLAAGVAYIVTDLPSAGNAHLSQPRFLVFGLSPVFLSSVGFVLYWASRGKLETEPKAWGFMAYGIGIMAAGVALGIPFALRKRRKLGLKWILLGCGFAILAGTIGGLFACWMTWVFTAPNTGYLYNERVYTWLSIPAALGVFALAQWIMAGLSSTVTGDEDREWFARATAWILIAIVCCLGLTGIALMPPVLGKWLPGVHWQSLVTILTGGAAAGLGGSGKTPATPGEESQQRASSPASLTGIFKRLVPGLVMAVFLISLLALIATCNELMSYQLNAWLINPPSWSPLPPIPTPDPAEVECLLVALLVAPALAISRFIDANKFSLHAMYRNRLIRTFLGASNRDRKPSPFTGFDPADNLRMADLRDKPLHVLNMTLNLVKGENLAWQERKGEPFTATKYRIGSCRVAYQNSATYLGGVTLGGAVAASGAAANPNMGYSSSRLLSVIMMLFNARLGAWLPNPGQAGRCCWGKGGPTFSVRPFIDEAFGLTTDRNAWVNISDGGHFENLGVYEMVLRRCATIIAVDASADPCFRFEDLSNAIRKIYVDMGITIDFPDGIPIFKETGANARHCAVGRIRYAAVDGHDVPDGTLIYIKASLTGNESQDVRTYAAQHPAFPHQSTADQWFNEAQFESYRRLGFHVVEEILQFRTQIRSVSDFKELACIYSVPGRAVAAGAGV